MSVFDIAVDADHWTAEELKQFLQTAKPDDIRQVSVHVLPDFLPDDVLADVEGESRNAAEELLFEANAYHVKQRNEIDQRFGNEVSAALDLASNSNEPGIHLQFKKRLKVLVDTYQANRGKKSIEQEALYSPHVTALEELLVELKDVMGAMARGAFLLHEKTEEAGELAPRFVQSANQLDSLYAPMERTLNLYYYVQVMMAGNEMNRVRKESSSLDGKSRILQVQINACRDELKRLQSGGRLNTKEEARKRHLEDQIGGFVEDLKDYEVLISETDLIGWLDVIVEASMSEYAKNRAKQAIRTGRLELFSLLQRYCELQEAAAKQIARNPFSQADPKKTIQFLMQSEQFILGYFARKKSSVTAWLGGAAADKIRDLGDIETDLINEMKQNKKKLQ